MMKKGIVSLIVAMGVWTSVDAESMICGKKDYTGMSQKKLMETYCSADAALTSTASATAIDSERTADLQRECLDEKGTVAKVLQQKFNAAPPTCSPLIESPKK